MLWNRRNFLKASIGLFSLAPLLRGHMSESAKARLKLSPSTSPAAGPSSNLSPSLDLTRLLRCIAEVETGNRPNVRGPNGEVGRHQLNRLVWKQHTKIPFASWSGDEDFTDAIAWRHIRWLERNLKPHFDMPYTLAYCWRGGLASWNRARRTGHQNRLYSDYAQRVSNLFHDESFAT